jgi:hypothetical protein
MNDELWSRPVLDVIPRIPLIIFGISIEWRPVVVLPLRKPEPALPSVVFEAAGWNELFGRVPNLSSGKDAIVANKRFEAHVVMTLQPVDHVACAHRTVIELQNRWRTTVAPP